MGIDTKALLFVWCLHTFNEKKPTCERNRLHFCCIPISYSFSIQSMNVIVFSCSYISIFLPPFRPVLPLSPIYHSFIRRKCGRHGKYWTIWAHGAWARTWKNDNSFYAPMVTDGLRKDCPSWSCSHTYTCACAFSEWICINAGKHRRTQMGLNGLWQHCCRTNGYISPDWKKKLDRMCSVCRNKWKQQQIMKDSSE